MVTNRRTTYFGRKNYDVWFTADRSLAEPTEPQSFLGKIAERAIWPKPADATRHTGCIERGEGFVAWLRISCWMIAA